MRPAVNYFCLMTSQVINLRLEFLTIFQVEEFFSYFHLRVVLPDDDQKSASVKRHQKAPSFSKVIDKGDWSISCKINDVASTFVLCNIPIYIHMYTYLPNIAIL